MGYFFNSFAYNLGVTVGIGIVVIIGLSGYLMIKRLQLKK